MDSSQRELSVVLLPPQPWDGTRALKAAGEGPSPIEAFEGMAEHGIDVTLIDPHPRPLNPLHGIHPMLTGLDPLRGLKVLCKSRRADLILSVSDASCLVPVSLRRISGFRPKIVVWDLVPEEHWRIRSRLQNWIMPRVDASLLLGASQEQYVKARWGTQSITHVVPQHVDTEFFSPAVDKEASRPGPRPVVLAVGEDSGRDFALIAAATHDLDVDLVVKTRQEVLSKPDRRRPISHLRERMTYRDLRSLYERATVVAIPLKSTINASGVSTLLEAMCMAKPIVVSDNPPIRDYFVSGSTALVAPPGDVPAFRDCLLRLLDDAGLRARLGAAARLHAIREFGYRAFAEKLARAIRGLVPA